MELKAVGTTSLLVSPLGLGTVKFGRNQGVKYPTPFELPSDSQIDTLLQLCRELNINLIDTAPAYGNSEERLGKQLADSRHDWVIMTKAGEEFIDGQSYFDFSKHALTRSIERSLKRLNTDYLDIVLIHSNGEDKKIIVEDEALFTLAQLKQKGWIRAIGMSTKTIEGGLLALDHSDIAMVSYQPLYTEEQVILDKALQLKKGIFIKKGLLSGHLKQIASQDPVKTTLEFIFKHPAVSSLVVGTLNPQHLKENAHWVSEALA
ncbi:MAG: aldo/keto reductase [Gammaproteobacteria bacterium]|nr:aldo/keto reductase [Gammaproteobacteria bacterium]